MRNINLGLLNTDLVAKKMPLTSIGVVAEEKSENRVTFVPYFGQYIQLSWASEPKGDYVSVLCDILSKHAGENISLSDIIDCYGTFPAPVQIVDSVELEEAQYHFNEGISEDISECLDAVIASGAQLERYSLGEGGGFYETSIGGDELVVQKLEQALRRQSCLAEVAANKILFVSANSATSLSINEIARWLIVSTIKQDSKAAIEKMNNFLMIVDHTVEHILCIDGFQLAENCQLQPTVRLMKADDIKSYKVFDKIFGGPMEVRGLHNRFPSAAITEMPLD